MNPKTRIRLLLAAGTLATVLVAPAAAGAATITWKGDTLYYTAAPGEANQTGPWYGVVDESKITISDGYGITVTDSTGGHCTPVADRFECDVPKKMIFVGSSTPWVMMRPVSAARVQPTVQATCEIRFESIAASSASSRRSTTARIDTPRNVRWNNT